MSEKTDILYEALASVLMENVQVICQHMERLSELGEETVFLSVNLKDDSSFYSGSSVGKRFMLEKSNVIDMFFQFCKEKYVNKAELTMADINAAKPSPQDIQDVNKQGFHYYVQSICEHVEKLALVGVNSIFLSVNMKTQSSFYYGSPLGRSFLSEKADVVDLYFQYCDDNSLLSKNQEQKEKNLSELMSHVQTICEHIEELSKLGEETLFLSVNLKNETSFYSGSKTGKSYLDFKSNVLDLFFQFCKVLNAKKNPAELLRRDISTQTERPFANTTNFFPNTSVPLVNGPNTGILSTSTKDSSVNTTVSSTNTSVTTSNTSVNRPVSSDSQSSVNVSISTTVVGSDSSLNASRQRKRPLDTSLSDNDDGDDDIKPDIRTLKSRRKERSPSDDEDISDTHEKNLKMLKCGSCSKYFHRVKELKKHEKIHEVAEFFMCEICGVNIYNKESFRIHMKMHKPEVEKSELESSSATKKSDRMTRSKSHGKQSTEGSKEKPEQPPEIPRFIRVSKEILKACNVLLDEIPTEKLNKSKQNAEQKIVKQTEKASIVHKQQYKKQNSLSPEKQKLERAAKTCSVSLKRIDY